MSKITATITADCTLVNHLLDTCESLIAACRELQKAKAPQPTTFTLAPNPVESVDGVILAPDERQHVAADTIASPQATQPGRLQHPKKWKDIDVLVEQAIDEPEEWHSCFLDEEQRTKAGFQRVISRLKYVAREYGIKLRIRRYLDEDDDGHFVHVQHGGAR